MSSYQGGLGSREGGDLIRWKLDIDPGMDTVRVMGSPNPVAYQARAATAELTLYDVNREESIAVIDLLNEMRSASQGVVIERKAPSIGDRFAGLDFV